MTWKHLWLSLLVVIILATYSTFQEGLFEVILVQNQSSFLVRSVQLVTGLPLPVVYEKVICNNNDNIFLKTVSSQNAVVLNSLIVMLKLKKNRCVVQKNKDKQGNFYNLGLCILNFRTSRHSIAGQVTSVLLKLAGVHWSQCMSNFYGPHDSQNRIFASTLWILSPQSEK